MTITTKLFELARLSGEMVTDAAKNVAQSITEEQDRKTLLEMSKRQLHKELRHHDRQMQHLVSWGFASMNSQYQSMVERRRFIMFLLRPSAHLSCN